MNYICFFSQWWQITLCYMWRWWVFQNWSTLGVKYLGLPLTQTGAWINNTVSPQVWGPSPLPSAFHSSPKWSNPTFSSWPLFTSTPRPGIAQHQVILLPLPTALSGLFWCPAPSLWDLGYWGVGTKPSPATFDTSPYYLCQILWGRYVFIPLPAPRDTGGEVLKYLLIYLDAPKLIAVLWISTVFAVVCGACTVSFYFKYSFLNWSIIAVIVFCCL